MCQKKHHIKAVGVLLCLLVAVTAAAQPRETFAIKDERFIDRSIPPDAARQFATHIRLEEKDGQLALSGTVADLGKGPMIWIHGSLHTWIGKATLYGYTFESDKDDPLQFLVHNEKGYVHTGGKGKVTTPNGRVVKLE